jgi:hypothetical protein
LPSYGKWYRSQVQGSTFRVKDMEGIEDPKSSLKMLIFHFFHQKFRFIFVLIMSICYRNYRAVQGLKDLGAEDPGLILTLNL